MEVDIIEVTTIPKDLELRILEIWKSAVKETHKFLNKEDIAFYEGFIIQSINEADNVLGSFQNNTLTGFSMIKNNKIEMLFIDPKYFNNGIGKQLVKYALVNLKVKYVDCNEQNTQAVGFYEKMGFKVFNRSAKDEEGRDFPILHMIYKKTP